MKHKNGLGWNEKYGQEKNRNCTRRERRWRRLLKEKLKLRRKEEKQGGEKSSKEE